MEMNQVRYFLALCEEKHFTRAAARCGVAQPSLTTAIKKLEQEFGGSLFDRRRGEPTELGLLVRPFLQGIAWNAATAMSRAQEFTTAPEAEVNGAADTPFPAPAMPDNGALARPDGIKWMPVEHHVRKGISAMD